MTKIRQTGHALSIPQGLAVGMTGEIIIMLGAIAASAKLIGMEIIAQRYTGYVVMIILLISSWVGSQISYSRIKRQKLKVCIYSAACYALLLLGITAFLFGGNYTGVGEGMLLVFCGSLMPLFSKNAKKKSKIPRKTKTKNR